MIKKKVKKIIGKSNINIVKDKAISKNLLKKK